MNSNIKGKVLVAEDDLDFAGLISTALKSCGLKPVVKTNGLEALDYFENENVSMVITDLMMPELNGIEFIRRLRRITPEIVIIVVSGVIDVRQVSDLFRMKIYDFINKPVGYGELQERLRNAFEHAQIKLIEQNLERENQSRFQHEHFKEKLKANLLLREKERFERMFFHNFRVALSQGAGFGMLLTLISMLPEQSSEDNQVDIKLEGALLVLLRNNSKVARRVVDVFEELDGLMNNEMKTEIITLEDFYARLTKLIYKMEPLCEHKRQRIVISGLREDFLNLRLKINQRHIYNIVEEVLLNALKYSDEDDEVFVLTNCSEGTFRMAFLNYCDPERADFIMDGGEGKVFEPFFRNEGIVDERFGTLEFGLGLTLVEKCVNKHGGKVSINVVADHFSGDEQINKLVNLSIEIPLTEYIGAEKTSGVGANIGRYAGSPVG